MKTANEIKGYNPLSVEPFSENWVPFSKLSSSVSFRPVSMRKTN